LSPKALRVRTHRLKLAAPPWTCATPRKKRPFAPKSAALTRSSSAPWIEPPPRFGEAVGIVGKLNQATLEHLKTRRQFGVPIGAFQVLQHRMADMYIAEEQMRSMAIAAALKAGSDVGRRAVAGSKAYIGEAARFVGQQAIQLHGAMGMVDDFVVSHYFRRLTMIDMTFGDADFQLARFSDSMTVA
jgi:alkylation response protein AidB-like acyl-CoA dehydrogenase